MRHLRQLSKGGLSGVLSQLSDEEIKVLKIIHNKDARLSAVEKEDHEKNQGIS